MLMLTRRRFLQLVSGLMASGIRVPAFATGREPYVFEGEVVNYIGHHPGGFLGGQLVHKVHPWDGAGHPVDVWNNAYGSAKALERYYDFDLANFRRDVPSKFWHSPANRTRYNNVHTYVREQRFGETLDQALANLNFRSAC